MSEFKMARILAPTDQSAFAQKAVDYARAMAKHFGAELHVLRVISDPDSASAEHAVSGIIDASEPQNDYSRWLAELVGDTGEVRRIEAVQYGTDVPDAILRYARHNDIDLIVLATHSHTGLAHLLIGSVTETVMRAAPCPVLMVHPETMK